MATDPQSLFSQSACYSCYTPAQIDLMIVVLLQQIVTAKSPGTDVTPATLLKNANCYACYATPYQIELMKLSLLAQIISLGG